MSADSPRPDDHPLLAELDAAREKIANLQAALETNREIGVAIGILMATHRITVDEAFQRLVTASQRLHRKLSDVAGEVLFTGECPEPPARRRDTEELSG